MPSPFEELLERAGGDGAIAEASSDLSARVQEVNDLLKAWMEERQAHIEAKLLLDRACALLTRMMDEGDVTPRSRRRAKSLLRAIHCLT
jgi:hypothetical protein